MSTCGLFITIEAKKDKEKDMEELLLSFTMLSEQDEQIISLAAVKIGRGNKYAILETFQSKTGCHEHLSGKLQKVLKEYQYLFVRPANIEHVEVVAVKESLQTILINN